MCIYSDSFCAVVSAIFISCSIVPCFIVIVLYVHINTWWRFYSEVYIFEQLIDSLKAADILGRAVAATHNNVNQIDSHNTEKSLIIKDNSKWYTSIEKDKHNARKNCVNFISTRSACICHFNHHIILVNSMRMMASILRHYFSYPIQSIIDPVPFNLFSILVSKNAHTMFDIINPLSFKFNTVAGDINSIAMSDILHPIAFIARTIIPNTLTNTMPTPVLYFSLKTACIQLSYSIPSTCCHIWVVFCIIMRIIVVRRIYIVMWQNN